MATLKTESLKYKNNEYEFIPPLATETDRGGIIADIKSEDYVTELKIGEDGKLYAPEIPNVDELEESISTINNSLSNIAYGVEITDVAQITYGGKFHSNGNVENAPTTDGCYYNYDANANGWIVTIIARSCSDASTYVGNNMTSDGSTWTFYGWTEIATKNDLSNYIPLSGSTEISGKLQTADEVVSTNFNSFRAVGGDYGFLIRNDGQDTYFLLTNQGEQFGDWNDFRPLSINNSTGEVSINNTNFNVVASTANAAYGIANRVKTLLPLVNDSIVQTFLSMNNQEVAYCYSWTVASDAHPNDYRGGYHFYEFYRGSQDYQIVKVYSTYGVWIGRYDVNGLFWLHNIVTSSNFSLSGNTLTITV